MVKLVDLLIGVGIGVLDESIEGNKITVGTQQVPAERIVRPVLFGGALAVDLLNIGGRAVKEVAETVEVATAPLVTKTAIKYMKETTQKTYVVAAPPAQAPTVVVRPPTSSTPATVFSY